MPKPFFGHAALVMSTAAGLLVTACGGGDDSGPALPQLAPATGATLSSCAALASSFSFANTTIASAEEVPAGTLTWGGAAVAAHCLVKGEMFRRTSAMDGNPYAIMFEMRMPQAWNGRFFYQANGGSDGLVQTALGGGGSNPSPALTQGFAVISSDAGHQGQGNLAFGVDYEARLDYGYKAVAKLTPMAKALIKAGYGKTPDRSYFGGCSNGGRHTFVAMTRMPEEYDGYLAGAPGYRLPLAAIANQFGAKRYASVATDPADLSTAFTSVERAMVSAQVVAKCDALDGATDGIVQDINACQAAFDFQRDVPTCSGARDGTCLSAAQKTAIAPIFSGATDALGNKFYASFPFDAGHNAADSSFWEFFVSTVIDPGATALIWSTPPADPATFNGATFALTTPIDDMIAAVSASNATYTESGLSLMQPVEPTKLDRLRNRGAKVMVYHGVSDPIFSVNDTTAWYEGLRANNAGDASNFARYYRVPGMSHCGAGPSTDQFDMLPALVDWVEKGQAPSSVTAQVRGPGSALGANPDVPAGWSSNRTRPLCPYPQVARLRAGATDLDSASSFRCE
ncbi:tannase/feruloyl esterase family alpha/beta hydrolase [Rhizobacter sp. Root1221]|uniref:tannase/feruloyl esterase family alpha/beta hydrolase n=1 Tax=Rhizobacter sp. Root1221 TaxID=1736433 RepID=UPI0006FED54B|nr:tannase/feruloyl esterase family alpha/beta hydrolase [Rhizobacter sp. Root1221]KQV85630.1 esterase [Rhizobacter sp. Root1221]